MDDQADAQQPPRMPFGKTLDRLAAQQLAAAAAALQVVQNAGQQVRKTSEDLIDGALKPMLEALHKHDSVTVEHVQQTDWAWQTSWSEAVLQQVSGAEPSGAGPMGPGRCCRAVYAPTTHRLLARR